MVQLTISEGFGLKNISFSEVITLQLGTCFSVNYAKLISYCRKTVNNGQLRTKTNKDS